MNCANCKYNDGTVYTSFPPKFKCTITDEFHEAYGDCDVDFVTVVRCKDCKYSDDYYHDGSCYCKHPEHEMRYIGTNWNWYCADGERKNND